MPDAFRLMCLRGRKYRVERAAAFALGDGQRSRPGGSGRIYRLQGRQRAQRRDAHAAAVRLHPHPVVVLGAAARLLLPRLLALLLMIGRRTLGY